MITPKQIEIRTGTPPLIATFDHCESEVAAAYMILAAQDRGEWFDMLPLDCCEAMKAHRGEPGLEWFDNPFARPNFHELVENGFAVWVGEPPKCSLRFTELGLERLAKSRWVIDDGRLADSVSG